MHPLSVLHIPHSSDVIPLDVRRSFLVSEDRLAQERLVSTDWYTDELYALPTFHAVTVRFAVSRLVVDPERFEEDSEEPLARLGRGVIYTRTADGCPLREMPSPAARAELLARYYYPHHGGLSAAVSAAKHGRGACLLLDCHSFPSRPLPCDLDQRPDRPDLCLGTDSAQTPAWLRDTAQSLFEAHGLTVAVESPYRGVVVPQEHCGADSSVHALMVEVNRRLYMNEETGAKRPEFSAVHEVLQDALLRLVQSTESRVAAQL